MRLCVNITDTEVERAKNVFKTSMYMHLDGEHRRNGEQHFLDLLLLSCFSFFLSCIGKVQLQSVKILEGRRLSLWCDVMLCLVLKVCLLITFFNYQADADLRATYSSPRTGLQNSGS